MSRVMGVLVISMITMSLLFGCGWEGSGVVVDKVYTPESEIDGVDTCKTTNGVTKCTDDDIEIAESWELQVRDDLKPHELHWVAVSEREFNATSIGDTYSTED